MLTGVRNWSDGLWDVVVPQTQKSINIIVRQDKTKYDLAEFLHKRAFSPALSIFQKAKRMGHFISWPCITDINLEKSITNLLPTAKGHLDQERSKIRLTKTNISNDQTDDEIVTKNDATKMYENAAMMYPITPKLTTYSDQTGRFPHRSSRGNEYLMIMYDFDANAILCSPLKNQQAKRKKNNRRFRNSNSNE